MKSAAECEQQMAPTRAAGFGSCGCSTSQKKERKYNLPICFFLYIHKRLGEAVTHEEKKKMHCSLTNSYGDIKVVYDAVGRSRNGSREFPRFYFLFSFFSPVTRFVPGSQNKPREALVNDEAAGPPPHSPHPPTPSIFPIHI